MRAEPVFLAASANRFTSCSAVVARPPHVCSPPVETLASRAEEDSKAEDASRATGDGDAWATAEGQRVVVYGSGKLVAVWAVDSDGQERGRKGEVVGLLPGHAGVVTVVKPMGARFISGDSKGGLIVWSPSDASSPAFEPFAATVKVPTAHTSSVSALAATVLSDGTKVVVSAGSDSVLKLWRIGVKGAELVQEIKLGNRMVLDAEFSTFGSSDRVILAVGSTDSKITVYTLSPSLHLSSAAVLSGHTDWIRCLCFAPVSSRSPHGDLLLASGSQDTYLRLWRFSPSSPSPSVIVNGNVNGSHSRHDPFAALDALEASLSDAPSSTSHQKLETKKHPIRSPVEGEREWGSVSAEAVLMGHESWITNVRFCPPPTSESSSAARPGGKGEEGGMRLLSSSTDRSMILWSSPADERGVWTSAARFGDFAATPNLGFFNCHHLIFPRSSSTTGGYEETVMASGWTGSWHVWTREGADGAWKGVVGPTGHFGPVNSLDWDAGGQMVLTSSSDRTSRIWGPWRDPSSAALEARAGGRWHELARPQVHGHDIFATAWTSQAGERRSFVSAGEEKVIRAFEETRAFVRLVDVDAEVGSRAGEASLSEGAVQPPLGLSNKVVEPTSDAAAVEGASPDGPPLEDRLLSSTLWPEVDKLFGHPSELLCLTTSPSHHLIASSCHANAKKHAAVRIWDSRTYRPIGRPLEWHGLGVGAMAFQRRGKRVGEEGEKPMLVTASRDRGWAVWSPTASDGSYELVQGKEQAHSRIIYDVGWCPEPHRDVFATVSRDKTVKVWAPGKDRRWELEATVKVPAGARCVDFAPTVWKERMVMAVGLEDGKVVVFSASIQGREWRQDGAVAESLGHVDAVTRLAFDPSSTADRLRLASAGEDGTVRILHLVLA